MTGPWDALALLYFTACGISRLARYNITADALAAGSGRVAYFEGTPIPTSTLLVLLIVLLTRAERIGPRPAARGRPPRPVRSTPARARVRALRLTDDQQDAAYPEALRREGTGRPLELPLRSHGRVEAPGEDAFRERDEVHQLRVLLEEPGAATGSSGREQGRAFPLYDVLGRRRLAHWTEHPATDDWSIWFYREPAAETAASTASEPGTVSGALTMDVRGLEPPLPMVRVLERLDTLAEGAQLEVIHDRRPMFLYPLLDERGFAHETDEPEPGVVRIRIRKRPRSGR
jgi:uncharacterized protein (DUF2249 family)